MNIVLGADDYLKSWAAKRIGIDKFGPSTAIGVQCDGDSFFLPAVGHPVCPSRLVRLSVQSDRCQTYSGAMQ
jgi:hypothetical protein